MISSGTVHQIPVDLRATLQANEAAHLAWEDITPLARNEWICWVESAKRIETRARRLERVRIELAEGIRRPCCWPGCIHRIRNG